MLARLVWDVYGNATLSAPASRKREPFKGSFGTIFLSVLRVGITARVFARWRRSRGT